MNTANVDDVNTEADSFFFFLADLRFWRVDVVAV